MSRIEYLQQRVAEAEERFGLIDVQQRNCSERSIALVSTVEDRLGQSLAEIGRLESEIRRQREANEQLRAMLFSLLSAIESGESGGRDPLSEIMRTMESKVAALIGDAAAPAETPAEPEAVAEEDATAEELSEPTPETAAEPEPEPAMDAEAPAEMIEEISSPEMTEEAAEPAPDMAAEPEPEPAMDAEAPAEMIEESAPPETMEEAAEPAPDMAAEPEPEPAMDAEAPAEMAGEIAPPETMEEAAEPAPDMAAEPEPAMDAEAPAEMAGEVAPPEAMEEAPEESGGRRAGQTDGQSDRLSGIMERVAQLAQKQAEPGNMSDAVARMTQLAEELAGGEGQTVAEAAEDPVKDRPDWSRLGATWRFDPNSASWQVAPGKPRQCRR